MKGMQGVFCFLFFDERAVAVAADTLGFPCLPALTGLLTAGAGEGNERCKSKPRLAELSLYINRLCWVSAHMQTVITLYMRRLSVHCGAF